MRNEAWQAWVEQLATGVARVDAGLRVCWLNGALAESLGSGMRSAAGQPLSLRAPDELAQARRALDRNTRPALRPHHCSPWPVLHEQIHTQCEQRLSKPPGSSSYCSGKNTVTKTRATRGSGSA